MCGSAVEVLTGHSKAVRGLLLILILSGAFSIGTRRDGPCIPVIRDCGMNKSNLFLADAVVQYSGEAVSNSANPEQ
jgi:hypothetical protein